MMKMTTECSEFVNSLSVPFGDFDYAQDYFTVWTEGGRRPNVADYDGLTEARATEIRRNIESKQTGYLPSL